MKNILITREIRKWLLKKAKNDFNAAVAEVSTSVRDLQYELSEVAVLKKLKQKNLRANRLPDAKKRLKKAKLNRDALEKVVEDLSWDED